MPPTAVIDQRVKPVGIVYSSARRTEDGRFATMGEAEIGAFLTSLAVRKKVSASTQNQALSALLFLYRHVLEQ